MNLPDNSELVLALIVVEGLEPYYDLAHYEEGFWRFPNTNGGFSTSCSSMKVVSWEYCSKLLPMPSTI